VNEDKEKCIKIVSFVVDETIGKVLRQLTSRTKLPVEARYRLCHVDSVSVEQYVARTMNEMSQSCERLGRVFS